MRNIHNIFSHFPDIQTHPYLCREHTKIGKDLKGREDSPPYTWGIYCLYSLNKFFDRRTPPTHVGNIPVKPPAPGDVRVHPYLRREYSSVLLVTGSTADSPLFMRGIFYWFRVCSASVELTPPHPNCARNIFNNNGANNGQRTHPHLHGEY